ncbi:hypothetical protein ASE14_18490 [Agromyces sp. Root81]|uniref:energy-coupling factor transporter transmembrane component T n=1 Tax=Agromyces sp. Root81 TaxID=1736601 RepID=UPI0006F56E09|nr:energy-coupling factor transporter transmembrane component T [Agromyces sp. Root81]KRC58560.1 hypothetical protein ASE14_18490 [Agromyces sp. Root81]
MSTATLAEVAETYRHPESLGNFLRDRNPITLLVALVSLAVVAAAVPGLITPFAVCAVFVLLAFAGGVGPAYTATYLKLWAVVGFILFLLRALLLDGEHVYFTFGNLQVTAEGVYEGLRFAAVVMAICGAVTLFFALVTMRRLMLALEMRGVSPRASYVLLASFQSMTDLGATAKVVLDAQKARGIETEGGLITRAKAFFPVLAPVFLSAMTATEERAIALDARAFNSPAAHSHLVQLPRTATWEWLAAGLFAAVATACVMGRFLGWL